MADRTAIAFGERVEELRREQHLTQKALADMVKRSVSWVSQVERGELAISDLDMLQRLAAVLGVPSRELVEMVLGEEAATGERQRPYVEALRLSLAGHPAPEAGIGVVRRHGAPVELNALALEVAHAWELVHGARYEELGPLLAQLIHHLEAVSRLGPEGVRPRSLALLAEAYQVAAAMLVKAGDAGAAWVAADRAIAAGERCGDRCLVMAGQLRMGHTFTDAAERALALHVLRQAVVLADQLPSDSEPGLVSLTGACALLLSVLEARAANAKEARRHLGVAEHLARRLGEDRNDYGTEFGPTNVLLHRVAVAVELGNAADALALTTKIDPAPLSSERRARYLVDVARAHAQRRDPERAVAVLEQAEATAPVELRELRVVRELLGDLEHLARRRQIAGLRPLRRRLSRN